jgi:hypothetical protein
MATFAEQMLAKPACGGQVRGAPGDGRRREVLRRPVVVHAGRSGGPALGRAMIHPPAVRGACFPAVGRCLLPVPGLPASGGSPSALVPRPSVPL